jgi:hypothetical protein
VGFPTSEEKMGALGINGLEGSGETWTPSEAAGLLALAERCERASSGNRWLDGLVWKAVEPEGDFVPFGECEVLYRRDSDDAGAFEAPPAYTTSVDAALRLIPEYTFEEVAFGAGTERSFAQLVYPPINTLFPRRFVRRPASIYSRASTKPLAICAAALRSLAKDRPA